MRHERERKLVTTITVPERIWTLLRGLAQRRTLEVGGRPNASAVVCELVEAEAARRAPRERAAR